MTFRILFFLLIAHVTGFAQGRLNYLIEELPSDSVPILGYDSHSGILPSINRNTTFKQCLGATISADNLVSYDKNSPSLTFARL